MPNTKKLSFSEAVERLQFHSGSHPDVDDPRWAAGFLQTLQPYRGFLDREAWDDVLHCVDAVEEHLRSAPKIDRRVINSLWGICHFARAWAIHPDGMLPRNRLITTTDSEKLATWIDDLSDRVAMLLDTQGDRRTDE